MPRARKTPGIKKEATRLQDNIDWSADIHEPVLTRDIQTDLDKEMTVPKFAWVKHRKMRAGRH